MDSIFLLPNIIATAAIQTQKIALTSAYDVRIECCPQSDSLKIFLSKFENQHGNTVTPSVLWWNASSEGPDLDAVCGFRDAISIAHITHHRTRLLVGNEQFAHLLFADYFSFYPWMLANNGEHLVYHSPGSIGAHELASFRGQSTPGLHPRKLDNDYDVPLLTALLHRWKALWENGGSDWRDLALFRSLNMAFAATLMPSGAQPATFYDSGRITALWVSAFEIISRENQAEDSNLNTVYRLLNKVPYHVEAASKKNYHAYDGRNRSPKQENIACQVYGELYHARNDFLHGNQVNRDRLLIPQSKKHLLQFTAPLYRLALTAFLKELNWNDYMSIDPAADNFWFCASQRQAECALLKSQSPLKGKH